MKCTIHDVFKMCNIKINEMLKCTTNPEHVRFLYKVPGELLHPDTQYVAYFGVHRRDVQLVPLGRTHMGVTEI